MRFLILLVFIYWPSAFASTSSTPLCDQLLAAAQKGLHRGQIELEIMEEKRSSAIFAFLGYDNGEDDADQPLGGIEYRILGNHREVLQVIRFHMRESDHFGDVGKVLLARILSMNPQVRVVREIWTGKSMEDWIDSLHENLTPMQALEKSPRTKLYKEHGFKVTPGYSLHFDRSDSTLEVNVDYRRGDADVPRLLVR